MKTNLLKILGPWHQGCVLDKHTVKSVPIGTWANGHTRFDTTYTEIGDALFQLKYRSDYSKIEPLASVLNQVVVSEKMNDIGFIVPMPPSDTTRRRQPVIELSKRLAIKLNKPCFTDILQKSKTDTPLKNVDTKSQKLELLDGKFSINKSITNPEKGPWNVLLVDDLYHTGASMEEAVKALKTYECINQIYVIALTWR